MRNAVTYIWLGMAWGFIIRISIKLNIVTIGIFCIIQLLRAQ